MTDSGLWRAFAIPTMALAVMAAGCRSRRPDGSAQRIKPLIPLAARAFPLTNVRLLDGPFQAARDRNTSYLKALDSDRLLHNFRVNAGLPSAAAPLGGWEEPKVELRGHFVGHYLSACALTWAAAGDLEIRRKADGIVAALAACQRALGPTGYLSAFPEAYIDRVIEGKRVWAPWYTLHKIMAGLLDMFVLTGNRQALEVVERLAGWVRLRLDRLDEPAVQRMLANEHGGMVEVLADLYAATGRPDDLALARRFDHRAVLDPLAAGRDELKGLHVNTQIPKILGAAREYELTGEKRYGAIASYFWDEVVNRRCYATGGTSNFEIWRAGPGILSTELSNESHETCCTYNLLRLTRRLFTWSAAPKLADYYERALWNGILSTQDPASGMVMYYVPMESGWFKTFGTPNDSFWCCTGTGVESHAKSGDSIYFHDAGALYVNLFIASELDWAEKGVSLRQETRFPEEEGTTLTVRCAKPVEFDLCFRIPEWAVAGTAVSLNGEVAGGRPVPSAYYRIRRTWVNGDSVRVRLPMALRLLPAPDDPNVACLMYGPLVLAGELPTEELLNEKVYGPYHAEGERAASPVLVPPSADPNDWIRPVSGSPLVFETVGAGRPRDIRLVPFHRLFGKRYALYWNIGKER